MRSKSGLTVKSNIKSGLDCSDPYTEKNIWGKKERSCVDCFKDNDTIRLLPDTFCSDWKKI